MVMRETPARRATSVSVVRFHPTARMHSRAASSMTAPVDDGSGSSTVSM